MLGRSELRLLSCAVPDMEYLHTVRRLGDVVENAIRSKDNLPQWTARGSGVSRPNEWERCQNPNVIQDSVSHPRSCLRIIPGDIGTDVVKVGNGRIRPDYFEVHADAQDSTNSLAS